MFQGSLGCFEEASRVFQGSFREISRVFQESSKGAQLKLKEFQVALKGFQGLVKRSSTGVSVVLKGV